MKRVGIETYKSLWKWVILTAATLKVLMVKSLNTAVSSISTLISPYLPAPSSDQYCSHFFCQKEKFSSSFSYPDLYFFLITIFFFCIMSFYFNNSLNKTPKLPCMLPSSWSTWLFCRLAFAKPSSRNRGSLLWWDLYNGKRIRCLLWWRW